jgi:hypothetical protein
MGYGELYSWMDFECAILGICVSPPSISQSKPLTNPDQPVMSILVWQFLFAWVILTTSIPTIIHYLIHGTFSWMNFGLWFFCGLNILISLWEMALGKHVAHIQKDYNEMREKWKGRHWSACMDFFTTEIKSTEQLFDGIFWSRVWSTYSLYDPSYQNKESFGFFIDVGNGWTTIFPTIVFGISMTFDLPFVTPFRLGVVCVFKINKEFYWSLIYFLTYIWNDRHKHATIVEVVGFVGVSNGLWISFPILGMYTCVQLMSQLSWAVFGRI